MFVVRKRVARERIGPAARYLPKVDTFEGQADHEGQSGPPASGISAVERMSSTKVPAGVVPSHREWNPSKRWNPFNSYKLLAHVERWKRIRRGKPIPAPVLVTVDPTNACNLNCLWCNAEFVRTRCKGAISANGLRCIAEFLPQWGRGRGDWEPGVKAVCVAGGGEPLLNNATGDFVDRLIADDIEVGVVTNGTMIHKFVDALSQAVWIGVSVDAATRQTFNKLKGLPDDSDLFDRIIENIAILVDYSRTHNSKLGWRHPAYGVSFKYLLHKENIGEVYEAAKLARRIGCKNIHFRPAGTTWDKLGTERQITFDREDILLFDAQVAEAFELDDEEFGVYGVTHKFNSQFGSANYFSRCHSIFMTAVFEPPAGPEAPPDSFTVGLCCDRRGDPKLELARNIESAAEITRVWGGSRHWKIHDEIVVQSECPRCTYQPHNEIYEQVILNDSMTYKFI